MILKITRHNFDEKSKISPIHAIFAEDVAVPTRNTILGIIIGNLNSLSKPGGPKSRKCRVTTGHAKSA